jgi:Ras-related protein Rab-11A
MSSEKAGTWVLKIAILGDTAVGKTSLVNQFVDNTFKEDYGPTIGADILKKDIVIPEFNSTAKLVLWDIAGQTQYEKERPEYYEGCSGALLVYDITRHSSYESIAEKWLKDYKNYVPKDQIYILIGNKNDLEDQRGVKKDDGEKMAKEIQAIEFIETSAKFDVNVDKAFVRLAKAIIEVKTST